jgi:hypothetical protein
MDDEDRENDITDDGKDEDDEKCFGGDVDAIGNGGERRGTPHNPHIRAAAGLNPGGLR